MRQFILISLLTLFASQAYSEQFVYSDKKAQAIITYGDIINVLDVLDINDKKIPEQAMYHIRITVQEAIKMQNELGAGAIKNIGIGTYICTMGLGYNLDAFYTCRTDR